MADSISLKNFVKACGALAFLTAAVACGYVIAMHVTDRDQISLVIQMLLMCAFFSVAAALVIFSHTGWAKNLLSGKTQGGQGGLSHRCV